MSTFIAFERAKICRFINTYGSSFTFRRRVLNDRKEPTEQYADVVTIDGVYHDGRASYVSETYADGSRTMKKPTPMILCLQDARSAKIMPDDEVQIGSRLYTVVRLEAVGGFGYAWEISLELIDDGGNV